MAVTVDKPLDAGTPFTALQIMRDAPWVTLAHTERYVAHQPWIEGYKLHPMWSARYEFVQVNR